MSDTFLRKSIPSPSLDNRFQNHVSLCLLRTLFGNPHDGDTQTLDEAGVEWRGEDYSPKEFAAHIQKSPWAVYKWLDPDQVAHFPVEYFFELLVFIRIKSGGTDNRLAVYVAELSGFAEKVRAIEKIIEGGKA